MFVLATIKKLTSGGIGPDELAEMLSAMGIEATFETVANADRKPEFEALWLAASLPVAGVLRIDMKMKDGSRFSGLLVLNQASNPAQIVA